MRLAYVNYLPNPGVFKKIQGQARAAKRLKLPLDVVVISDDIQSDENDIKIIPLHFPENYFKYKWSVNFSRYRNISKCLDLSPYDRIILRYIGAEDGSWRYFMRKYGNKIISEHHTYRYAELKALKKGALNFYRAFFEKKNSPRFLLRSIGIIAVTDELRQYYCSLVPHEKPSITIPNGIDTDYFPLTGFAPFDGTALHLIFMASTFYPWHGLSRVLSGLTEYKGRIPVTLSLIGKIIDSGEKEQIERLAHQKNVKINIAGELFGKDVDDYFSRAHLAISSLALFRNRMKEACVLKTREYITRGIPFIYAYDDSDLTGEEDFALKMEKEDKPVDIESLMTFVRGISRKKGMSRCMRTFASRKLSWEHKMQEMVNFAVRI